VSFQNASKTVIFLEEFGSSTFSLIDVCSVETGQKSENSDLPNASK
jgi:hypothetical protein